VLAAKLAGISWKLRDGAMGGLPYGLLLLLLLLLMGLLLLPSYQAWRDYRKSNYT
jgi:hypothetical protein